LKERITFCALDKMNYITNGHVEILFQLKVPDEVAGPSFLRERQI